MTHSPLAHAACALLATAGCVLASPSRAASNADIQTRMLAQEGMAIGLASNVLQSQLNILFATLDYVNDKGCHKLNEAGSVQALSVTKLSKHSESSDVVVYYDDACKTPYIEAQSTVTETGTNKAPILTVTQTSTYAGPTGTNLGSLSLSESATFSKKTDIVIGTGTFTPANGSPSVNLGLTCTIPSTMKTKTKVQCQGGIAQNFPSLNLALASVTPLNLVETEKGKRIPVTFSGSDPNRQYGPQGSLSITESSPTSLGIAGSGTNDGPATTTGSAADFVLFPPTPTSWQIVDQANQVQFTLKVVSNQTRNLAGSVVNTATSATLATIAVDQSGTGTIAYAGEGTDAITNWLLAD
jgi:hypothetical protein